MNFNRNSSFISYRSKAKLNALGMEMFAQEGSFKRLGVKQEKLENFIQAISRQYRPNYYHNFNHAIDTLNSMCWLLGLPSFYKHIEDFDRFLLLICALVHDVDHPGNDNQWEIKSHSEWARESNSPSVIEFHSIQVTKNIIAREDCNILSAFADQQKETFINELEALILWTDFAQHHDFMRIFDSVMMKSKGDLTNPEFHELLIVALLKAADIGNLGKPFPIAKRWGYRVMQESWAQGEREKANNMEVGRLNDPENADFHEAQARFIGSSALQFFQQLEMIEPELAPFVSDLKSNQDAYKNAIGEKLKSVK